MAAYRLQHWSVSYYLATTTHPAYVDVTLDGTRVHGFIRHRAVQHCDKVRVVLLPTDTVDGRGSKVLVKRAMTLSADKWKGTP